MHAQRTAEAADGDEELGEVGLLGEQLGELVADDEEPGQRLEGSPGGPGLLVVADVEEVAGGPQHLLAPVHLARQRVVHPVDHREVVLEVGDDGGGLGEVLQPGEGRAALEVDEDEVELLGAVGHGEGEHEGAQQLGLAGAGGADDEAVRAHPAEGGLLDVELDRLAGGPDADGHAQQVAQGPRLPHQVRVEVGDVAEAEHVGQLGRADEAVVVAPGLGEAVRREAPGEGVGLDGTDRIGDADPVDAALLADAEPALARHEPQAGPGREAAEHLRDVDEGDADEAGADEGAVVEGDLAAVDDDDDVRLVGGELGLAGEAAASGQLVGEHLVDLVEGAGDHPDRAEAVDGARVVVVREPLQPVPLGASGGVDDGRDEEPVGAVERRELADRRPDHGAGGLPVAADVDDGEGRELDGERQVLDERVGLDELAERDGADGVDLVDGPRLREGAAGSRAPGGRGRCGPR